MQEDAWLRLWMWSWLEEVKKETPEPDSDTFVFQPLQAPDFMDEDEEYWRRVRFQRLREFQ
jgi:hypothetical protein